MNREEPGVTSNVYKSESPPSSTAESSSDSENASSSEKEFSVQGTNFNQGQLKLTISAKQKSSSTSSSPSYEGLGSRLIDVDSVFVDTGVNILLMNCCMVKFLIHCNELHIKGSYACDTNEHSSKQTVDKNIQILANVNDNRIYSIFSIVAIM